MVTRQGGDGGKSAGDGFAPRSRPVGRAAARLAGFAALIAIAGCAEPAAVPDYQPGEVLIGSVYTWRDADTGCRYLIRTQQLYSGGMGGMTPKLRADGTVDCPNAPAIEARRAETGTGSVHESAVPKGGAQ